METKEQIKKGKKVNVFDEETSNETEQNKGIKEHIK